MLCSHTVVLPMTEKVQGIQPWTVPPVHLLTGNQYPEDSGQWVRGLEDTGYDCPWKQP
jgi:hypothetical protein